MRFIPYSEYSIPALVVEREYLIKHLDSPVNQLCLAQVQAELNKRNKSDSERTEVVK